MDFQFITLQAGDKEVIRRIVNVYLQNDEVSKSLNLSAKEGRIFADAYIEHIIPQNMSIGIFDIKTGELVGCGMASDRGRYLKTEQYTSLDECSALQKLSRFDEILDKNVESVFPAEKCMVMEFGVVKPTAGGRGLGNKMQDWLEFIATREGYDVLFTICLSNHSIRLFRRRGWIMLWDKAVNYKDYRDPVTGEALFKDLSSNYVGAIPAYKRLTTSKL